MQDIMGHAEPDRVAAVDPEEGLVRIGRDHVGLAKALPNLRSAIPGLNKQAIARPEWVSKPLRPGKIFRSGPLVCRPFLVYTLHLWIQQILRSFQVWTAQARPEMAHSEGDHVKPERIYGR